MVCFFVFFLFVCFCVDILKDSEYISKNIKNLHFKNFYSFPEAKQECFKAASLDGCALVVFSSNSQCTYYSCVKHSLYRNIRNTSTDDRKRKRFSKRSGCKMKICIRFKSPLFQIKVLNPLHNHIHVVGEAFHQNRKLNPEQFDFFQSIITSNDSAGKIKNIMKEKFGDINIISRDIYNLKSSLNHKAMKGRTEFQFIIDNLEKLQWNHRKRIENDFVTALLFIPSSSLLLLQIFHNIIVVDSTYKTNKNNYILFEGIGVSNTWNSFTCFYCFISGEKQVDYNWIMSNLQDILGSSINIPIWCTDRDQALMNSIKTTFPTSTNLICSCFYFL
jgi:hypothetical protein